MQAATSPVGAIGVLLEPSADAGSEARDNDRWMDSSWRASSPAQRAQPSMDALRPSAAARSGRSRAAQRCERGSGGRPVRHASAGTPAPQLLKQQMLRERTSASFEEPRVHARGQPTPPFPCSPERVFVLATGALSVRLT
jgi:hypothetical protein